MTRPSAVLGLGILLLSVLSAPAGAARQDAEGRAARPAGVRQVGLGAAGFPGYDDLAALDAFTAETGRVPAIWTVWSDWGGGNSAFPSALAAGIRDRGSVPMINWQPVLTADRDSRLYGFQNIANGLHDQYIRDAEESGDQNLVGFFQEVKRENMARADRAKQLLVAANRDGLVELTRADLVAAMDPALVAASQIDDLGSTFHFVTSDGDGTGG